MIEKDPLKETNDLLREIIDIIKPKTVVSSEMPLAIKIICLIIGVVLIFLLYDTCKDLRMF